MDAKIIIILHRLPTAENEKKKMCLYNWDMWQLAKLASLRDNSVPHKWCNMIHTNNTYEVPLPKFLNLNLIKPLNLTCSLQELDRGGQRNKLNDFEKTIRQI